MAKKRKTLPKDFDELLRKGNLQELKEVFDKCEWDARGGYGKETALAFDHCPHELAQWLVEQGLDVQAADTYGNTPLHSRSRSIFGNIKSLLELGADVNNNGSSIGTPLHSAADSHNVENTALLLAYGAKPEAVNSRGYTPLEQALSTCSNIDIENTHKISNIYLQSGIPITPRIKKFVTEIGERFEFHRSSFDKESVDIVSQALEELYRLAGVEPVAKRVMYDGKTSISVISTTWQKQHQELWELLVPSSGPAATVQGEAIRITGRISIELEGNGGINWDADYKKMCDTFLDFVQQGTPLSSAELTEAAALVKDIKQKSGDTERLCQLAVKWVMNNPQPVTLSSVGYKR